jgi:ABC-type lipoprotein release transport system permease subunit
MYKLFLTLRYLTRKKIVVFPILVVWLCLMMMIIVTSIMGGFVDRVREANRDLLGDIVISNNTGAGWPYYQELQDGIQKAFPGAIAASTPVVRGYGLMNLPAYNQTFFAQITGIDPATRSKVSRFHDTLFRQYISPHNVVEDLTPALPATSAQLRAYAKTRFDEADRKNTEAYRRYSKLLPPDPLATGPAEEKAFPNPWWLLGVPVVLALMVFRLVRRPRHERSILFWFSTVAFLLVGFAVIGLGLMWPVMFPRNFELAEDALLQARTAADRAWITLRTADELPAGRTFTSAGELADLLIPKTPSFDIPDPNAPMGALPIATATAPAATSPAPAADDDTTPAGCIVGIQFPLFNRDKRGNFDRSLDTGELKALLTVVPILPRGSLSTHPQSAPFVIVDDSYTGVYDVDSTYVYAPFEKVQYMAGMRSPADPSDPGWFPPRCNEVLFKLAGNPTPSATKLLRAQIADYVESFERQHPAMLQAHLEVQTWDEKQARYLGAVQNEKHMMTFILGLMSLVVLVVVFLIFYMIVRDKTRDIGIIKAVGGSEAGVAGIFLTYGLFIGLVGGALGALFGVLFVTHTNQIHEWIYRMTGIMIWDRSVYLFDRIPDQVNPWEVALYFALSVIAGVVGAAIPAIVAAAEDPVKAVRYE